MLRNVFLKTLHEQRRGLLGWLASIVLIVLMYAAIWPSLRGQPSMTDFLDQMPEAFRSLFATSGADMSTPVGYIQIELMSFMGPMLVILYAVVQGSRSVAGEEERRTMDLLLAAPVSRARVLLEKAAAMVAGTVGLTAAAGSGPGHRGAPVRHGHPGGQAGGRDAAPRTAGAGVRRRSRWPSVRSREVPGSAVGCPLRLRWSPTSSTGWARWSPGSTRSRSSRRSTSTSRTTRCGTASRGLPQRWQS